MSLDENSSREEVLGYIEMHPYSFLCDFSDKTWAQPYIDEAAKRIIKKDSFYFLHYFLDKPWAKPYTCEASEIYIEKYPFELLTFHSDKPWAQPHIDKAVKEVAEKKPEYFIKKWASKFPQYINLSLFALGDKNETK